MWHHQFYQRAQHVVTLQGVRQSLITIGGSLVASLAAAVALMVLTRQLGPIAFGQFSVGFSLMLILIKLNDWGMTTVLQKYGSTQHDHQDLNHLFSWVTNFRFMSWGATIALGFLSYQWLTARLRFDQPEIILYAFLLTPVVAWSEHLLAILQSLHRFSQAAVANGIQGLLKAGVAGFMFITANNNPGILILLYAATPSLIFIWPKLWLPGWFKLTWNVPMPVKTVQLKQVAFHGTVAVVIAGLVENVDILFVQRYLDSFEVGLLAGINMIALLFSVLAYALSTVLNPRAARYSAWPDQKVFLQKAWWLFAAAVVGWVALIPLTSLMIEWTIGPAYLAGSPYLVLLLAASVLSIAIVPFAALFYSSNQPWFFSVTAVVQLLIILIGNIGFVPEFGLAAAVWTRLTARLVLLVLTLFLVHVYFRQPSGARPRARSQKVSTSK